MAEDQTNFVVKPEDTNGHSKVLNVSIRGWIALILTITVCLVGLQGFIFALVQVTGVEAIKVEEPLYSAFLIALGFYFGQNKK